MPFQYVLRLGAHKCIGRECKLEKKTIYVPLEIKARELASQVLLGAKIAERGGRVYLGSKKAVFSALRLKSTSEGTLLYKGGMGNESGFKELKMRVSKVAVLDQEMSPSIEIPNPASRFVGEELNTVDRLYYVGQEFADAFFLVRPETPSSMVRAFGWPRVDLWTKRYSYFWEFEAEKLRERFGEFVLFSSDFGVLSVEDQAFRSSQQEALWEVEPGREETDRSKREKWEPGIEEYARVVDFLRELDREPAFPTVVVRPHPGEDHSIWARELQGLKKTHLVYEGDISAFLSASEALLHRGCTTALQAELGGKPTGVIVSEGMTRNDKAGVSAFSKTISDVQDALALVSPGYQVPEPQITPGRISSLDGTASEKIAEDLLALTENAERRFSPSLLFLSKIFWINLAGAAVSKYVVRKRGGGNEATNSSIPKAVAVNKIPGGVQAGEVRAIVDNLGMGHLDVQQVARDLVCIEAR